MTMNIDTMPMDLLEIVWDHMSHGDRFTLRGVNKALSRDRMDGEEGLRESLRGCRPNRGDKLLLSSWFTLLQTTTEIASTDITFAKPPNHILRYWVLTSMYRPMYIYLNNGYDREGGILEELLGYIKKFNLMGRNKFGIRVDIRIADLESAKKAVDIFSPFAKMVRFNYCPVHYTPGGEYNIPWGVTSVVDGDAWDQEDFWHYPDVTHIGVLNIPETVTVIGADAFCECTIDELNLPNSIRVISSGGFSCASLKGKLILPKNIEVIESMAFAGNPDLIPPSEYPSSLIIMGTDVFRECVGWNEE